MTRRPRRNRPPILTGLPTFSPAPDPATAAQPRPLSRRQRLVTGQVAGTHSHLSTAAVLAAGRALVRGDARARLGIDELDAVSLDEVEQALKRTHGFSRNVPRASIDPECTLRAADEAVARVVDVAARGGRIALATGRPASLLAVYQQLARTAHAAGGDVTSCERFGPFRAAGRSGVDLWWVDGVAVATSDGALLPDDGFESGEEWSFAVGRVDLAVGDRGFAGAMVAAGIETVAFADLDSPALAVAASRGRPVTVVPLDETRPAVAYDGLLVTAVTDLAESHPDSLATLDNLRPGDIRSDLQRGE